MPLLNPDPIFQGITTALHRQALHRLIRDNRDGPLPVHTYLSIGAGQFTDVETMIDAGVPPTQIHASDITLFSSVLGYLADPARSVADLQFEALDGTLQALLAPFPVGSKAAQAATILWAIRWTQFINRKTEFDRWQRIEFERTARDQFDRYVATMERFGAKCGGLSYAVQDMREVAAQYQADPHACLVFSPPWYSGGYARMFSHAGIYRWAEPAIAEMRPEDGAAMFAAVRTASLWAIAFVEETVLRKLGDGGWHRACVEQKADYSFRYLLSNRPVDGSVARRKIEPPVPVVYPIYADADLTPASDCRLVPVDARAAMYYYDLFIKGLGMPGAEAFYLLVLDGRVAGVTGLHFKSWAMQRVPVFTDVFSITMPASRYKLGRLLTRLLCTREIAEQCAAEARPEVTLATRLQSYETTFISASPSVMKVRGLMKLKSRLKLPNQLFKLRYTCALKDQTAKEVFDDWLAQSSQAGQAG